MPAAYPSPEALEEAVDLYKDEIDMKAVYAQLVDVAENYPDRTREFALVAAAAVAKRYCKCTKKPEPFDDKLTVAEKRKLAAHPDHPGLCGKEMVEVIVSVRTEAVEARGGTTGNRFRNQVSHCERGHVLDSWIIARVFVQYCL